MAVSEARQATGLCVSYAAASAGGGLDLTLLMTQVRVSVGRG